MLPRRWPRFWSAAQLRAVSGTCGRCSYLACRGCRAHYNRPVPEDSSTTPEIGRSGLQIAEAVPADAADLVSVMHAAFAARGPVDPPPAALSETPQSVAAALAEGSGVIARVDGRPAGGIVLAPTPEGEVVLTRVSVHPQFQGHGLASEMVAGAQGLAARAGFRSARLFVRSEFPELARWWQRRGYRLAEEHADGGVWVTDLPVAIRVPNAEAMKALGRELADLAEPGDVIIATGGLGAGKTTLTQGIGDRLGVGEDVISPTFVLSRIHRTGPSHPDLVHVDAYRLGSAAELDDLDLEASLGSSLTVIEWGRGLAEQLAPQRLELDFLVEADDSRTVLAEPVGQRWDRQRLRDLAARIGEAEHV
ncbi:tRNA threonylcarbamoyladenosine biosynthesis protein TsaE [Naumannella halotolerans]|uniref:tRNA threonylcarbamoyladenosine biosynthesis protein TsaE n=1 Tax=Naumannella halotolerans TaxID=993414 RepID=A0A4R7J9M9_9ACTN|nr:tRNA threonylcarbamoyladenosine biosynthesis protein TsaE [Naumannella halotolerans]